MPDATLTDDQRATATTVLTLARAGRFAEIRDMYVPSLQHLVTAEELEAAWTAEVTAHGQVTGTGQLSSTTPAPGFTMVTVPVRLERAKLALLVTMTSAGQLAGLQLVPAGVTPP